MSSVLQGKGAPPRRLHRPRAAVCGARDVHTAQQGLVPTRRALAAPSRCRGIVPAQQRALANHLMSNHLFRQKKLRQRGCFAACVALARLFAVPTVIHQPDTGLCARTCAGGRGKGLNCFSVHNFVSEMHDCCTPRPARRLRRARAAVGGAHGHHVAQRQPARARRAWFGREGAELP